LHYIRQARLAKRIVRSLHGQLVVRTIRDEKDLDPHGIS
jgi:hypothetical protein